jgi:hypothetical protein
MDDVADMLQNYRTTDYYTIDPQEYDSFGIYGGEYEYFRNDGGIAVTGSGSDPYIIYRKGLLEALTDVANEYERQGAETTSTTSTSRQQVSSTSRSSSGRQAENNNALKSSALDNQFAENLAKIDRISWSLGTAPEMATIFEEDEMGPPLGKRALQALTVAPNDIIVRYYDEEGEEVNVRSKPDLYSILKAINGIIAQSGVSPNDISHQFFEGLREVSPNVFSPIFGS